MGTIKASQKEIDEIISKLDMEMIDGLILSDAYLERLKNKFSNSRFQLYQSLNHYDLMDKVSKMFFNAGIGVWLEPIIKDGFKKNSTGYMICTKRHPVFRQMRLKWYPNGKKIIPKDLVLTPKTIAYWFMGDGHSGWIKGIHSKSHIGFSTHSFSKYDVELLIEKLKISIKINDWYTKLNKEKDTIELSSSPSVARFFDSISKYIVPSFEYKIRYPIVKTKSQAMKERYEKMRGDLS